MAKVTALLALGVAVLAPTLVVGAGCNGHSTPGPPNLNPIDVNPNSKLVRTSKNGKLYSVGDGDDALQVSCQNLVLTATDHRTLSSCEFDCRYNHTTCFIRLPMCGVRLMTWVMLKEN